MAELNILQRGDKAKFLVYSQNPNFDMETCDFYLEIIYGMREKKITIPKSEFLVSIDMKRIFMFPTDDMVGKVTARMVWQCKDADASPDEWRQEVDEQVIVFVVDTPCPKLLTCPSCSGEGHDVSYELTDESGIAERYMRLCATEVVVRPDGTQETIYPPLLTSDYEYIYTTEDIARQIDNNN